MNQTNNKSLIICLASYIVISLLTLHFINEDAYIYFRVAENIANGFGYVFNIGGEHIETGSSLPWQLLFSLLAFTPIHLVIWAKIIGIALGCCNLYLVWKISDLVFKDKSWLKYPVWATLVSLPFYMWMQLGLDTPLNTFCLLWLVYWLINKNYQHLWHWPAIAVFYTRPEGFFYLLAILPSLLLFIKNKQLTLRAICIFIVFCLLLFAFRLYYFHDLLPHAFYHKISISPAKGAAVIVDYFLKNYLLILITPAIAIALTKKSDKNNALLVLLSFSAICLIWASLSYDWNLYNRHIGTALPFIFILIFYLFSLIEKQLLITTTKALSIIFISLTLVSGKTVQTNQRTSITPLLSATTNLYFSPDTRIKEFLAVFLNPDFDTGKYQAGSNFIGLHFMANLGKFIKLNYPENSTIIWDQLGRTPWFSGENYFYIDNAGLCDKNIGYYQYHRRIVAQDSFIHQHYEKISIALNDYLWPEQTRLLDEVAILNNLFKQQPLLVIARKPYLNNRQDTILHNFLKYQPQYKKKFEIHNTYIVFENSDKINTTQPILPKGIIIEDISNSAKAVYNPSPK